MEGAASPPLTTPPRTVQEQCPVWYKGLFPLPFRIGVFQSDLIPFPSKTGTEGATQNVPICYSPSFLEQRVPGQNVHSVPHAFKICFSLLKRLKGLIFPSFSSFYVVIILNIM